MESLKDYHKENTEVGEFKINVFFSKKDLKVHTSMIALTANVFLDRYYRKFKTLPSVGEIIGHKLGALIFIEKRYYIHSDDGNHAIGLIIKIDPESKDLSMF